MKPQTVGLWFSALCVWGKRRRLWVVLLQYYAHDVTSSHLKRHLQCAEQLESPSNFTKYYCACHGKSLSWLILVTSETLSTVRGASGVILQLHQILHLPRTMALMMMCDFTQLVLDWAVTLRNCYLTELLLYWAVTLQSCYFTELLLYWTVTLLNCYLTELWLDWTVTWLNCYWAVTFLNCCFTELLIFWAVTLLSC